jgi:hypothetical protein
MDDFLHPVLCISLLCSNRDKKIDSFLHAHKNVAETAAANPVISDENTFMTGLGA